jgi:alkyl hydroperoxide reductase subunit AhpF
LKQENRYKLLTKGIDMGIFDFLSGGVSNVIDSVGKVIDNLTTTDEEKSKLKNELQNELNKFSLDLVEKQNAYEHELTERLEADTKSDSWLAKNIRPLTLIFILSMYSILSLGSGWKFNVTPAYVELLGQWGMLIMSFYFGGRSIEKIINTIKNRKEE